MGLLIAVLLAVPISAPKLFAPGIVSTEDDEVNGGFSPDGSDYYFARLTQYTTFPRLGILCVTHLRGGRWSEPEVLPFSGAQVYDTQPHLAPDGQTIFFTSTRPAPGKKARVFRVWTAHKKGDGWGEPEPLPEPINSEENWNWSASVTSAGTLYFTSDREERFHPQLYRAPLVNGVYQQPEKLWPTEGTGDADPFVSPDEKLLVFSATRPGTIDGHGFQYPRGDLYVSVRKDGAWGKAQHLEHGVNTEQDENSPSLSPDGKVLYFTSERSDFTVPARRRFDYADLEKTLHSIENGHGNVYYVSLEEIGVRP